MNTEAKLATKPIDIQNQVIDYYSQMDQTYQHWANSAKAYELHYGFFDVPTPVVETIEGHCQSLVRMNEKVAEVAEVQAEARVLDAGCGVGASALWLADTLDCRVHGISLSEYQVERARNFASQLALNPSLLSFSNRDFVATGFPDESFDVVWGLESICHAPDKSQFIAEAWRLLRPGGRLVVADYFLLRERMNEIETYSLERWLRGWVIPNLASSAGFKQGLKESGFRRIQHLDITENIRPSAEEIYRRGRDGYPKDILNKCKNVLQIQHVEACLFQKTCLDLGLWRYQIFSAQKHCS